MFKKYKLNYKIKKKFFIKNDIFGNLLKVYNYC